jgi:hypothetical protein
VLHQSFRTCTVQPASCGKVRRVSGHGEKMHTCSSSSLFRSSRSRLQRVTAPVKGLNRANPASAASSYSLWKRSTLPRSLWSATIIFDSLLTLKSLALTWVTFSCMMNSLLMFLLCNRLELLSISVTSQNT